MFVMALGSFGGNMRVERVYGMDDHSTSPLAQYVGGQARYVLREHIALPDSIANMRGNASDVSNRRRHLPDYLREYRVRPGGKEA